MTGRERVLAALDGRPATVRVLRISDPDSVECSIGDCHRHAGERCIVGAGCEVACGKPYENVRALARCTQEHL
jgi:hypothetical protein